MLSSLFCVVCLICVVQAQPRRRIYAPAKSCDPASCLLPTCRCADDGVPGNLPVNELPQLVMFTMDDGVTPSNFAKYKELFDGQTNPDGCPQKATFFVCGSANNYDLTTQLVARGHEVADHTVSHRTPATWWKDASYDDLADEIIQMRVNLEQKSQVNNVTGYRSPFLQTAGDATYEVLADYGFRYDSSLPARTGQMWWPYTLDYITPNTGTSCVVQPCPTDSYPGLWEVPLVPWTDDLGYPCSMFDGCVRFIESTPEGVFTLMMRNFRQHYDGVRSPFPMFGHSAYFDHPAFVYRYEGLKMFLKEIRSLPDVYFVSVSQVIDWTQSPTPHKSIRRGSPWKC